MKIYIIGGKAKSGKNTFGEMLRDNLKEYGYKPCVMQITEPLYSYARNYFEYDIDLKPGGLDIGKTYIVDKTTTDGQEWYLFRVPIKEFTRK